MNGGIKLVFISSLLFSIIFFTIFKIKYISKIKIYKLNIIISISFSTLFTIIMLIFSFINVYTLGLKDKEYQMDNFDILVNNYKIIDSEIIISILRRGLYVFVVYVIILSIFLFTIDLVLFIINKKEKCMK
jgi:hypothetical protein